MFDSTAQNEEDNNKNETQEVNEQGNICTTMFYANHYNFTIVHWSRVTWRKTLAREEWTERKNKNKTGGNFKRGGNYVCFYNGLAVLCVFSGPPKVKAHRRKIVVCLFMRRIEN